MDDITFRLARFAAEIDYTSLPAEIEQLAAQRLLDTLACAVGGYDSDQARIGRRIALAVDPREGARPIGSLRAIGPEQAAFVNTCMIRNLDYNDFYPGGHPSDCIGALLAVADTEAIDGPSLLTGLVCAYEVFARVSDGADLRTKGFDQGYAIGLATTAGLGSMLRLPVTQIAEALAIVATANVHLRSSRAGQLSLWKGAATAFATHNAVFATRLAMEGMTGPESPIEGRHGLWEQMSGPFELAPFPDEGGGYAIGRSSLKFWPIEYNTQVAVWAARRLAEEVAPSELDQVEIGTYWSAWHETGSEPAKWDPQTRETADHSMPYIFTVALEKGAIDLGDFSPKRYLSGHLRPLMKKISVSVDDDCEGLWSDEILMKVEARTGDGRTIAFEERNPKGFWRNPMTDDEVAAKFARVAQPVYGDRTAILRDLSLDLHQVDDVSRLLDLLQRSE